MEEPHVHGLLHLAVLAVALTGGYLGLDKLGHEKFRSAFDSIAADAALDLKDTPKILKDLDIMKGKIAVLHPPEFGAFWQYMICYITGTAYEITWNKYRAAACKIWYFFRRQRHIPLLGYFRKRWDFFTVIVMLIWTITSFFYLVALTLDFGLKIPSTILCEIFFSYLIVVIWIFLLLVILQWKLPKMSQTLEGCSRRARDKLREVRDRMKNIKIDDD